MTVELTDRLTAADLAILEKIYLEAFPPEERRPWGSVTRPEQPGRPHLYGIIADGRLAGMVTVWVFDSFAYIEHLAVDPSLRGGGIGAQVLAAVSEEAGGLPLLVEVEHPSAESPETLRRIAFYERNGFMTIATDYIQPPYADGQPEVALRLMATAPIAPTRAARTLHSEVYNKKPTA